MSNKKTWEELTNAAEKRILKAAIIKANNNLSQCAKNLKISRSNLYYLTKKYKIENPVEATKVFESA